MELKDAILSTLAELEEIQSIENRSKTVHCESTAQKDASTITDEKQFLQSIQERLLVLFEGFQSPNNSRVEAKVDLTLNFLEYLLASIESRINLINNKGKA